jgi:hypothetical protein
MKCLVAGASKSKRRTATEDPDVIHFEYKAQTLASNELFLDYPNFPESEFLYFGI